MSSATDARVSSTVPPPCASTKPPRRRSLARETKREEMPRASSPFEFAVAFIAPKPTIDSTWMSSIAPATTKSALPALILSTPSSMDTAAVAQAPTGLIIEP